MREILQSVAGRAGRSLEEIQERRVAPSAETVAALDGFLEALPVEPTAPADVIAMLDDIGSPATVGMAGRRYFGFVIGGLAAGGAGGELAGRRVGSESRPLRRVADRNGARGSLPLRLAARCAGAASRIGRSFRHRRDDGQLHGARGSAPLPC